MHGLRFCSCFGHYPVSTYIMVNLVFPWPWPSLILLHSHAERKNPAHTQLCNQAFHPILQATNSLSTRLPCTHCDNVWRKNLLIPYTPPTYLLTLPGTCICRTLLLILDGLIVGVGEFSLVTALYSCIIIALWCGSWCKSSHGVTECQEVLKLLIHWHSFCG